MKRIDSKTYEEIKTWIYRNARPLDLAVWQFWFEGGSKETVVNMLSFYQNQDGGFGNALEPDCWNTESSPYAVSIAIGLLRSIDGVDLSSPVVQGILRYLESGVHCSEDGWLFSIPSNDRFPRAPWWTYSEESNALQSMGLTAVLSGFIIRFGDKESSLFQRAWGYADKILKCVNEKEDFGEMGVGGIYALIQDIEAGDCKEQFECSQIKEKLSGLVNSSIERDTEKWKLYTIRPSQFISFPNSPFYAGNEEIVEKELDYLIDTRNPGGVWSITWSWFDLGERYAKEFAVSENWWMAQRAIENLGFLKAFGRFG